MRAIAKQGQGGYHLSQAHANPPQTPQQAASRWGSFAYKKALLDALLDEQYQLCCYSELRADEEGLGNHVEHVENKSQNPSRTFDYSNLAASALDSPVGLQAFAAQRQEVFGGHALGKRQAVDFSRFISCHQSDCQRFFAYLSDGRIVPAQNLTSLEQGRAQYTIDTLNLNSPFLITRRRQWWDELDDLFQEHINKGWSLPELTANLTMLYNEVELLDRFEAAAKSGFKGIEHLFPYPFGKEELAERLQQHGLTQVLHNLATND